MNEKVSSNELHILGGSEFLINIRYQQHHSWQGSIQRLDTGEVINFRSTLELMFLIESAIGQSEAPTIEKEERFRSWKKEKEVDDPPGHTGATGA
ncbi:MAG: hypothetical protein SCK57_02820 [Bacillota bacterium]|nr:hypothetical protein [Bacillota bacterium]